MNEINKMTICSSSVNMDVIFSKTENENINIGIQCLSNKDLKTAKSKFLNEKTCSEALNLLGIIYCLKNNEKKLLRYFSLAMQQKNVNAIYNLFNYYTNKKNYEKAIECGLVGVKMNNIEIIRLMAYMYWSMGNCDSAIKYLLMGVEMSDIECMRELGTIYGHLKDYDNAIYFLSMGIKKGDIECLKQISYVYYDMKDHNNAINYLLMGIEKDDIECLRDLFFLYRNIKDYDNAAKYFLILIEKDNYLNKYDYSSVKYSLNSMLREANDYGLYFDCKDHLDDINTETYNEGFNIYLKFSEKLHQSKNARKI